MPHAPVAAPAPVKPARPSRRRGRLLTLALVAAAAVLGAVLLAPYVSQAVLAVELPLEHETVIREQARDKNLDPALIAAVINAESRFQPGRVSETGARGLMQLMPETAQAIAAATGGSGFKMADLDEPDTGISYGSWYLRRLLEHYDGETLLAVAAYNAGMGNVDSWVAEDPGAASEFTIDDIPFPETQAYAEKVLDARDGYRDEHGLRR